MKKMLLKLGDSILSREQLKTIKGGYGDGSTGCSTTCKDSNGVELGTISTPDCNDTICECKRSYSATASTYCYCS